MREPDRRAEPPDRAVPALEGARIQQREYSPAGEELVEAYEYVATGQKVGSVVITLD